MRHPFLKIFKPNLLEISRELKQFVKNKKDGAVLRLY